MLYIGNRKTRATLNGKYIHISHNSKKDDNIDELEMYLYKQNIILELDKLESIIIDIVPLDTKNIFPSYSIQDSTILDIKAGVIIPKKLGITSVEVSIGGVNTTINVTVIEPGTNDIIPSEKIYNVVLSNFNISNDGTNPIDTSNGINSMLNWAVTNGYKKVIFPVGTYQISETIPVNLVNNLTVDLNGATLQINPSTASNVKIVNIPSHAENIRLTNGIVRGDKDSRVANNETVHGILINNGKNIELDNLEVTNILAYGISWDKGARKSLIYISKDNLEPIDDLNWNTKNYIDITNLGSVFQFSNPFGYHGLGGLMNDTVMIDVKFYDSSKILVNEYTNIKPYRNYNKPVNSKYVMLKLKNTAIGNGNTDFGNSVFYITDYYSENIVIRDCNINNCKALGIAYSGSGLSNVIKNCVFTDNGGAYATRDLDLEDGWEFMQNLIVRDCTFNSKYNAIICAGSSNILYNNIFKGTLETGDDGRCQNIRIIDNNFIYSSNVNNTFSCEWCSGAMYFEGNSITNGSILVKNIRNKDVNRIYFKNNEFINYSRFINNSTQEKVDISANVFSSETTIIN